jgi:hypothetical protein
MIQLLTNRNSRKSRLSKVVKVLLKLANGFQRLEVDSVVSQVWVVLPSKKKRITPHA